MLTAKYQSLPPAAQRRVEALVEALDATANVKPKPHQRKRFAFDWKGGLEDLKGEFTAVELQHHLADLR